jgi:hypothetical protein
MLVTAPKIASLLGRPRLWGYRQMQAGRYGPIVRQNMHHGCVHLAAVEAAEHVTFTPQQLAAAGVLNLAVPTMYFQREFVAAGGLISYGPDRITLLGGAAALTTT